MFQRFIAWAVDRVVLLPLSVAIFYLMITTKDLRLVLLLMAAEAIYKPVMEKTYGATLGKLATKIRVVSQTGRGSISWNQAWLRFLPWAISFYVTVFVYVRYVQSPGFAEVVDMQSLIDFMEQHPLSDSTLIGLLNSMPVFSMVWGISDLFQRAIHDRVAKTLVVFTPPV